MMNRSMWHRGQAGSATLMSTTRTQRGLKRISAFHFPTTAYARGAPHVGSVTSRLTTQTRSPIACAPAATIRYPLTPTQWSIRTQTPACWRRVSATRSLTKARATGPIARFATCSAGTRTRSPTVCETDKSPKSPITHKRRWRARSRGRGARAGRREVAQVGHADTAASARHDRAHGAHERALG